MEREFISIIEAGRRFFGVSHDTAYKLARNGTIPTVIVGRRRKVDVARMEERAKELLTGQANANDELLKLVRNNIAVIEFALSAMANSEDIRHHIRMEPDEVAKLANALREACEQCAS